MEERAVVKFFTAKSENWVLTCARPCDILESLERNNGTSNSHRILSELGSPEELEGFPPSRPNALTVANKSNLKQHVQQWSDRFSYAMKLRRSQFSTSHEVKLTDRRRMWSGESRRSGCTPRHQAVKDVLRRTATEARWISRKVT